MMIEDNGPDDLGDDGDLGDISNIVELSKWTAKTKLITEDSVAQEFAREHTGRLLYDHDAGSWFQWSGHHWQQERTERAFHWARELIRRLTESEALRTKFASRKTTFAKGVEKFAKADPIFAVSNKVWNKDPMLLATPNGTIDLRTGELRAADPADRINKIAAVTPIETAECPRWFIFLDEVTGQDDELIGFLQRWCGYCLTGDIREHALVFCYGPGGNGKSVFANTVSNILGEYSAVAAMETFVASQFDHHTTDLAMLAGARLVTASETEEGRSWAEAKIKKITGGEPVSARFMRCDNFTYMPQFKLMIIGNYEPALRNVDDAARRRFNIVPFTRKPKVVDKTLPDKLRAEWGGILRWAIEGCVAWQAEGLMPPETVRAATGSYFENQDLFQQWLDEQCVIGRDESDTSANLFASWAAFTKAAGERAGTRKAFARLLERQGFVRYRRDKARSRAWNGLRTRRQNTQDDRNDLFGEPE